MTKRLSRHVVILLSCLAIGPTVEGARAPGVAVAGQAQTNPDAKTLLDFKHRVDDYMALHDKLKRQVPPLKETKDPAKIQQSQDALAEAIRAARKTAKAGDIFTPEIRQQFRRLMYPETKGPQGAETKEALKEDAPKGVPIKVNAKYPESAPLPTMPPNLLAALPKLPENLEYRVINRDLILRDVHANLIVDFIPNAIQ
jgi:hypothetical protein